MSSPSPGTTRNNASQSLCTVSIGLPISLLSQAGAHTWAEFRDGKQHFFLGSWGFCSHLLVSQFTPHNLRSCSLCARCCRTCRQDQSVPLFPVKAHGLLPPVACTGNQGLKGRLLFSTYKVPLLPSTYTRLEIAV